MVGDAYDGEFGVSALGDRGFGEVLGVLIFSESEGKLLDRETGSRAMVRGAVELGDGADVAFPFL